VTGEGMNEIVIFIFRILPTSFLSRIFGFFAGIPLPRRFLYSILEWYCRKYQVQTDEMNIPENGFRTLEDFFTRKVKKGVHQIDFDPFAVISPVDSRIDQFGEITGTRVMQAKDIDYLVSDLIPASIHHTFLDGTFITLYLSPGDYHRIHSPLDGFILGGVHVPGRLFPVREYMVNGINGLFAKNERIITYLQTEFGICAVCKIGAMNVGKISVCYSDMMTNTRWFCRKREIKFPDKFRPQTHKGDEMGVFHLGSTVILLFQKDMVTLERFQAGQKIRMGQRIATVNKKTLR
jgi:phosphatidylserine decarboxylase